MCYPYISYIHIILTRKNIHVIVYFSNMMVATADTNREIIKNAFRRCSSFFDTLVIKLVIDKNLIFNFFFKILNKVDELTQIFCQF